MSSRSSANFLPSSASPTVLIIEDHQDLREAFREVLKYAGFAVLDVSDGPAALRLLEDATVHIIVLDLRLPTLDGYSVREELAAHAHTRDIPVVVVTGSDADVSRLDPACVMRKPVDLTELVRTVRRCLEEKSGAR